MTENITGKRRKQINKNQLEEVWKDDVLANWENHWDFKIDKPKNFYESKEKSTFEKICPCIWKWQNKKLNEKL